MARASALLLQLPPFPTSVAEATGPAGLAYWLLVVAAMRALAVVLGYAFPMRLKQNLFITASKEYTYLTGRTFAVWTVVTGIVCVLTALNIHNAPLLLLALATFITAISYFLVEFFVFGTVSAGTVTSPFVVASISAVWLAKTLFF